MANVVDAPGIFGGMVDIIPMHTRLPTSVENGHGDGVRDQSDIEIIVLRGTMISPR
jgi:hypothetical protein